jgi:hypothetical protein
LGLILIEGPIFREIDDHRKPQHLSPLLTLFSSGCYCDNGRHDEGIGEDEGIQREAQVQDSNFGNNGEQSHAPQQDSVIVVDRNLNFVFIYSNDQKNLMSHNSVFLWGGKC